MTPDPRTVLDDPASPPHLRDAAQRALDALAAFDDALALARYDRAALLADLARIPEVRRHQSAMSLRVSLLVALVRLTDAQTLAAAERALTYVSMRGLDWGDLDASTEAT